MENEAPREKSIGQKGRSQWTSIQNPQRCTQEEYGASEGPQWVSGNRQFLLKGTKSMDTHSLLTLKIIPFQEEKKLTTYLVNSI